MSTGVEGEIVEVFSDADWAGDHDTRISTSGCLVKVFNSVVLCGSKKQRSISRSTLESEYIAASDTAQNLQWIIMFLEALEVNVRKRVPFYMDNTAAIGAIGSGAITNKTKHIDISYNIARELQKNGIITARYLSTDFMQADSLKKPLTKVRMQSLMESVGVVRFGEYGSKIDREKGKRKKDVDDRGEQDRQASEQSRGSVGKGHVTWPDALI